jgi:hypothetical protein
MYAEKAIGHNANNIVASLAGEEWRNPGNVDRTLRGCASFCANFIKKPRPFEIRGESALEMAQSGFLSPVRLPFRHSGEGCKFAFPEQPAVRNGIT